MVSKWQTNKKTNESIKQELLDSLKENDVEKQGLNETANIVNSSQKAIVITSRFEEIMKTQKKKA